MQERYSKTAKGQSNLYLTRQFAPQRRSRDWVGWLLCMKMLAAVGVGYVGWMCIILFVMLREFSVVADL